jgi:hypothetical protein
LFSESLLVLLLPWEMMSLNIIIIRTGRIFSLVIALFQYSAHVPISPPQLPNQEASQELGHTSLAISATAAASKIHSNLEKKANFLESS